MSDRSVTWQELRAELLEPGDEPEVARLRAELIARQRAYQLAEARQRLALRQEDAARGMAVSQARVSQIENGVLTSSPCLKAGDSRG